MKNTTERHVAGGKMRMEAWADGGSSPYTEPSSKEGNSKDVVFLKKQMRNIERMSTVVARVRLPSL
jgi:hypothetical protein